MRCGAADAVRGASSPPDELAYIMRQSDSSGKKPFFIFSIPALMHSAVVLHMHNRVHRSAAVRLLCVRNHQQQLNLGARADLAQANWTCCVMIMFAVLC